MNVTTTGIGLVMFGDTVCNVYVVNDVCVCVWGGGGGGGM